MSRLAIPDQRTDRRARPRVVRLACVIATAASSALFLALIAWLEQGLVRTAWASGYVMMVCLLFLAAFSLRKKLPTIPWLGRASIWMQLHIHVALFSFAVYIAHAGWEIPQGTLERALAGLYLLVFGSGVYGLVITRTTPRKLTATGFEVLFEQIPSRRRKLAERARALILESARSTDILARYYMERLATFMERPRSMAYHLAPSLRHSRHLMSELGQLDRYLSATQRDASRELASMVREKEDLDYHRALQGRLKLWLFVHIGLTYGLLAAGTFHGLVAHAFGGGMR